MSNLSSPPVTPQVVTQIDKEGVPSDQAAPDDFVKLNADYIMQCAQDKAVRSKHALAIKSGITYTTLYLAMCGRRAPTLATVMRILREGLDLDDEEIGALRMGDLFNIPSN